MRYKYLLLLTATVVMLSCKKDKVGTNPIDPIPWEPTPTDPVVAAGLLKEINVPNLPSPYYHFEYNSNRKPSFISFASEFRRYNVSYNGDKIKDLTNNIVVNKDKLQYVYDNTGKVSTLNYTNEAGTVFMRNLFTYNGQKLIRVDWERKTGVTFTLGRTMTMEYYADGNLQTLTEHFLPVSTQPEATRIDTYEQYDNKVNIEGFTLLHTGFFDNLVYLPEVELQKNNPGKVTRTGTGAHYKVDFTYTYNTRNQPTVRLGAMIFLTGTQAGQQFQLSSFYSYY